MGMKKRLGKFQHDRSRSWEGGGGSRGKHPAPETSKGPLEFHKQGKAAHHRCPIFTNKLHPA